MLVPAWWRRRSQADRFDLYIRLTLYSSLVLLPLGAAGGLIVNVTPGARSALAVAAGCVQVVLCVLLMRAGIAHYLDRRPFPRRLVVAAAVWPMVAVGVATDALTAGALTFNVTLYAIALATLVRPAVVLLTVGTAGCAAAWALGAPALAMAAILVVMVPACRVTLWTLGLIRELERARHVQAVLAVAEERLRFARDLHDVIGRTLSVVALKSELAAQLTRRGRDEAVGEMLEVRQVAQDALVELRALVGGYRAADLSTELAGARALLESAGITCRVEGAGEEGLPAAVQGALGWVVREGTTNVLRHSEARDCVITLHTTNGAATLIMANDTRPAPPTRPDAAGPSGSAGPADSPGRARLGNGLVGLSERIAALGGTVTAEHTGGDGFRLVAVLPFDTAPDTAPELP
ncbi:MAG: histidine kinase [Actinoplanes sp.]